MKNKMRQELQNRRDNLPDKDEKSNLITQTFLSQEFYKNAKTIMIYKNIKSEVQTKNLIKTMFQHNKRVFLPITVEDSIEIGEILTEDILMPGCFNVPEPKNKRPFPLSQLDIIIVPAIAFDKNLHRLGYGKGYYDRFLVKKEKNTLAVGFCYDALLEEKLPVEYFDQKVDVVITEKGVLYEKPVDQSGQG